MKNVERLIGAVIVPELRPPGGTAPGAPARLPSFDYLRRFPPLGAIGFGRRLPDGLRIDGLQKIIAELVESSNRAAGQRPFVCADLECGAGYHLPGASLLPPARAMAAAEFARPGSVREAAVLTGLEARRAGIDLVLAPVLDVNTNPANPIIGVRAFGTEVADVIQHGAAFLEGLGEGGAGACIKHYPGHGDTCTDSHLVLPRIDRDAESLERIELAPFHELLHQTADASKLCVMIAHLDIPALTGESGLPTTLSPLLLRRLRESGFQGAALTDGLAMKAVSNLPNLGASCLLAGCDGLLAPVCEEQMALEILSAVESGELPLARLEEAAGRMAKLRDALQSGEANEPTRGDAAAIAGAALQASKDFSDWCAQFLGRSYRFIGAPGCEGFEEQLACPGPEKSGPLLLAACATYGAGGGAELPGEGPLASLRDALGKARESGQKVGFVWFGAEEALFDGKLADLRVELLELGAPILVAFAPSEVMVCAVAELLDSLR